jgi:methylmalonyl-CoA/ethylmalonyl-CoA epimerase
MPRAMNESPQRPIRQIAYIVDDLDASIRHWAAFAGIGPWTVYRNTTLHGHYRGVATSVTIDVGLSYRDELQIELIRVASRTPSPYQHDDGRARIGMHHIAWHSDDLPADIAAAEARGLQRVFDAGNDVVRVAYFASPLEPGLLLELIAAVPAVRDGFSAGVAASRNWDGSELITQVIDFGDFGGLADAGATP